MDWLKEHKFYVFAGLAAVVFFFYSSIDSERELEQMDETVSAMEEPEQQESFEKTEQTDQDQAAGTMMADIKGAVAQPGVYVIEDGDRIIDLIDLAGGLLPEADASAVNFALHVTDEMAVYIPRKGEEPVIVTDTQNSGQAGSAEKINLNKASASDLETLPGIGPSKSAAIIEYRETNGPFKTAEDLKEISGIGEKTFDKLKELITVN